MVRMGLSWVQGLGVAAVPAPCLTAGGSGEPLVWRDPREMQPLPLPHSKPGFSCQLPLANHS